MHDPGAHPSPAYERAGKAMSDRLSMWEIFDDIDALKRGLSTT